MFSFKEPFSPPIRPGVSGGATPLLVLRIACLLTFSWVSGQEIDVDGDADNDCGVNDIPLPQITADIPQISPGNACLRLPKPPP